MANLTITLDADLLRRARIRALEEWTSVNAEIREHVQQWLGEAPYGEPIDALLNAARASRSGSGPRPMALRSSTSFPIAGNRG